MKNNILLKLSHIKWDTNKHDNTKERPSNIDIMIDESNK